MTLPAIAIASIYKNGCPFCSNPIGEFEDEISLKEFHISGMCQACQNYVFSLLCEGCGMEYCECEPESVSVCGGCGKEFCEP
jgi:hypothetical protein